METSPESGKEKKGKVPTEIFKANLKGNEEMPQRYFGIFVEMGAVIFNAKNPEAKLKEYLLSALDDVQLKKMLDASLALHYKYDIRGRNGDLIVPGEQVTRKLWAQEQKKFLDLICEVLGISHLYGVNAKNTPTFATSAELRRDLFAALKKDPSLYGELGIVFSELRTALRANKEGLAKYKNLIKNRGTETPNTHAIYGGTLRDAIIDATEAKIRKELPRSMPARGGIIMSMRGSALLMGL